MQIIDGALMICKLSSMKYLNNYLLYYSPLSVSESVKSNIVSVSDIVCTLEVELLDMVVVEIVVTSVVTVATIYINARVQYGSIAL